MMNTRCTKLSMVRDDSQSSKTSNKKCPVDLHGDHNFLVGGEVNVARIHFLIVSLANVSLCLDTFYDIVLFHYCKLY